MRSLIWAFVVRLRDAFYFMTGPKSSAVINSKTMLIAGNIIAMRSEVVLLNVKIPILKMGLNQTFLPLRNIHNIIDNPPRENVFSGHTRTCSQRSLLRALPRTAKVYRIIHAIPHSVRQNLTEFWPFWTPFLIRFSNLTEFAYHFISYFLKN